jgi:hypothetical protein
MDTAPVSASSGLTSINGKAEPPTQNLMSSKHLPLLQTPPQAYDYSGLSFDFEDFEKPLSDVGFEGILAGSPSLPKDRILPPPRRGFKKSRKGCKTCKARKVKVSRNYHLIKAENKS